MAHGTRGRLALLGTGLLVCLGCMPDEKPIGGKSLPKSQLGSTVKPNIPQGTNQFGSGVQPAAFNSPAPNNPTRTNTPSLPTSGMTPPAGLAPSTPPGNGYGLAGSPVAQPTYPGLEATPPAARGENGLPLPPIAPQGAGYPTGR
jgi:hypothetical protein